MSLLFLKFIDTFFTSCKESALIRSKKLGIDLSTKNELVKQKEWSVYIKGRKLYKRISLRRVKCHSTVE